MIALLNLSVLGFLLVFHDKAKRTQQGNLLVGHQVGEVGEEEVDQSWVRASISGCLRSATHPPPAAHTAVINL